MQKIYQDPAGNLHALDEGVVPASISGFPSGCIELTAEEVAAIRAAQNTPTQEMIIADFTAGIQKRLDDFARTRNYDGILSACTYATSSVTKFQAEGQYCVGARDSTWAAAYQILDQALAGNWPTAGAGQIPANIADIEGSLPALAWPTPA